MTRLPLALVVALLVVGCVSVSAPTALPTASPTLGITTPAPATISASPSTAPSESPTAAPTDAPTATVAPSESPSTAPSDSAVPSGSPLPSTSVPIDFGADTPLFYDDFSDTESGWGVGSNAGGTIAYADDSLRFDPAATGSWIVSRRSVDTTWNVMRIEAGLTPSGAGFQGLLCAVSDDDMYGAVAGTDGRFVFAHLTPTGAEVLSQGQEAGWEITPGVTTTMALDCAGTDTGALRLQLSLPDIGLVTSFEGTDGPASFDRAALYAESAGDGYSLIADDAFVYGGTDFTGGQPSGDVAALLDHVPSDWRDSCFQTPPSSSEVGALVAVACAPTTDHAELVEYVLFESKASMDAAYQQRVQTWAVEPTGDCETGPDETEYSIGGSPVGRAMCAPQTFGLRFDWTHDPTLILSSLTDFESSYSDNYEDWLIAGPM